MTDPMTLLASLERPRLLLAAARHVAPGCGAATTRGLLHGHRPAGPAEAILRLMDLERAHEDERCARAVTYSAVRHIGVLAALLAEAGRLQSARVSSAPPGRVVVLPHPVAACA